MNTYIITGAGSGMGAAAAVELASQGHRLVLIGRTEATLRSTQASLNTPERHVVCPVDISDKSALRKAFQDIDLDSHNVVGIFANAGIGGENRYGDDDRWEAILNVNLTGTYNSIMETLPHLKKSTSEFKHILMTSSCLARFGVPNYTAYCTSKAGLLGLTRSLAVQLASRNILVNAICPGWVDTEMAREGIQKLADRTGSSYEEAFEEQMGLVPLGRISSPEEIGKFVAFMFSDAQTSITGQGLDINNGSHMQ